MGNPADLLLTIAIPTYNRAIYLTQQLSRLVPQVSGRTDVELLVCDNAGTDDTGRVVESFRSAVPSLRYVVQERNRGLDANIYTCYERAAGRYVWFVSDDDVVCADAVATVIDALGNNSADSVLVMEFSTTGEPLAGGQDVCPRRFASFDEPDALAAFFKVIMISTLILKKTALDMTPLYLLPPTVFPQITLALLLLKEAFGLALIPKIVIQRSPGNVCGNFFELYCLKPRTAIRHAAWPRYEAQLLRVTEKSLREFVRLEFFERVGKYVSKQGLPFTSLLAAFRDYRRSPVNICCLLAIGALSLVPVVVARCLYGAALLLKTGSPGLVRARLNSYLTTDGRTSDV